MSGTLATYQGFPCRDVRFRRTRGWRADTTTLLLFAVDFPQGFEFVTPGPGQLADPPPRTRVDPDLSGIEGAPAARRPRPVPRARRLEFSGALVLAEVDREGKRYLVEVEPLYVIGLETVKRDAGGRASVVQVRLVDARYFYSRGFLRRWSFNRTDGAGLPAPDSLKPDGSLFTLGEVAQEVAQDLFGTPQLARYPQAWDQARPEVELPRFGSATAALARLSQEHGAAELCLNLDGSVALWEPGLGAVGYAPDGAGAENTQALPPELLLFLRGAGQTQGVEATYPPDYVLVVGGLRVATVRVDELDPVLVIDDAPIPLTEETVRTLTGGKFGLEWLHGFVLAPQAYQGDVDLDPRVTALLREQAYRLWRIPDVQRELPEPNQEDPGQGPLVTQGPNARLLPLRPRAETAGGKRLPIRIEAYRFASVHRAMAGSKQSEQIATIRRQLRELKRAIREHAFRRAEPDPWSGLEVSYGFYGSRVGSRLLYALSGAKHEGVSFEQFQGMLAQARVLKRAAEISPGLAGQYQAQLAQLYGIDAEQGGTTQALFELAQEVAEFEEEVFESRGLLEDPAREARQRADELRARVRDQLRAIARQREQQATRTRLSAAKRFQAQTAVFVRNLPRDTDPGARVYSAELGIVETSDLSGHVAEEGVPVAEATSFVPKSPLVTFGAVLRPKPEPPGARPVTGAPAAQGETMIPDVLSDRESYYVAAFQRVGQGRVGPLPVGQVPAGEGVVLQRPDLVELVPLESPSNRGTLDATAQELAQGLVTRPDTVEGAKRSVARPWPVNCDGVVSGVEIAMRPGGKGFVTTVYTGSEARALYPLGRTRVRPRRPERSDAAEREGLTP